MDKSRGWSNKAKVSYSPGVYFLSKLPLHPFCFLLTEGIVGMAISKADQPAEGGITKLAAIIYLFVVESGIVIFSCCLNSVVFWVIGLNNNFST